MSSSQVDVAPQPLVRKSSPARAWLHALELTEPIAANPGRILPTVVQELAERFGDAPALLSEHEYWSFRQLAARANRYSRWALAHLAAGDTVALLMPNRPEYPAIWLGLTAAGGVVALVNTNLVGRPLAHCLNIVSPKHVIVATECIEALGSAVPDLNGAPIVWSHGTSDGRFERIDVAIEEYSSAIIAPDERRKVTIADRALYMYTSGTTGLPKAAIVDHRRLMTWSHWFAGMMDTKPGDRMYNCLPLYHSVGGVVAIGAVLVGGSSVFIRERFSARHFWDDVVRWDCTLFQYIGELCRFLLNAAPHPQEAAHRIRLCCGNGLRADVWTAFKARFRIPQILEFYAATEGNVSLFNVEGKPGAIGRVPPFLTHRFPAALITVDTETGRPVRNERGFCIRCAPSELGLAIGKIDEGGSGTGGRFDGYTSREESEEKILRNVFKVGDTWFATGDLMRKDERGYFYFVDRIGDTFRWKGENVSTAEVSEAIAGFPAVAEANVYGVAVSGAEGRAGMAALTLNAELELTAFRKHLVGNLPAYARPLFLRIKPALETTATFKQPKSSLASEGYDPRVIRDPIYFDDPARQAFVPLNPALYDAIQRGQIRL